MRCDVMYGVVMGSFASIHHPMHPPVHASHPSTPSPQFSFSRWRFSRQAELRWNKLRAQASKPIKYEPDRSSFEQLQPVAAAVPTPQKVVNVAENVATKPGLQNVPAPIAEVIIFTSRLRRVRAAVYVCIIYISYYVVYIASHRRMENTNEHNTQQKNTRSRRPSSARRCEQGDDASIYTCGREGECGPSRPSEGRRCSSPSTSDPTSISHHHHERQHQHHQGRATNKNASFVCSDRHGRPIGLNFFAGPKKCRCVCSLELVLCL